MNIHAPPAERLSRDERSALMREERRVAIMTAALAVASRDGWRNMTRETVASEAGVAVGSVNHEFGTMAALRDAVMQEAVDKSHLAIVGAGIAEGHPITRGAPADVREAAIRAMA